MSLEIDIIPYQQIEIEVTADIITVNVIRNQTIDGLIDAASQTEVNTGTNATKFVSPSTFAGASKWDTKISHALATAANDFLVASGVGVFVKKTLAETLAILKLWNSGTLTDGATIAADCDSYIQFAWDLTTVETAINPITFTNLGKVVDIAIYKTNAANTVVTLAATGYIFHFYDADNDNYSEGTNCTLSGAAGTSYSLNMVVTGIAIIQVTGAYASFA
jgi:hypothetical protein